MNKKPKNQTAKVKERLIMTGLCIDRKELQLLDSHTNNLLSRSKLIRILIKNFTSLSASEQQQLISDVIFENQ